MTHAVGRSRAAVNDGHFNRVRIMLKGLLSGLSASRDHRSIANPAKRGRMGFLGTTGPKDAAEATMQL